MVVFFVFFEMAKNTIKSDKNGQKHAKNHAIFDRLPLYTSPSSFPPILFKKEEGEELRRDQKVQKFYKKGKNLKCVF